MRHDSNKWIKTISEWRFMGRRKYGKPWRYLRDVELEAAEKIRVIKGDWNINENGGFG